MNDLQDLINQVWLMLQQAASIIYHLGWMGIFVVLFLIWAFQQSKNLGRRR